MTQQTICILGGTGFVGLHLANRLSRMGYNVRIPSRRRERHRELLVIPNVDVIDGNIANIGFLHHVAVKGCDIVINLVAILNEKRRGDFHKIHVDLPSHIVRACSDNGVKRLLHISALNADAQRGPSEYLKSKGAGEDLLHKLGAEQGVQVTSFQPSIIFGPGDHFFNLFAALLRFAPPIFPVVCPKAKFAPVYVGDVVSSIVNTLHDQRTFGQRYPLCGPREYTFEQIVNYTNKLIGSHRLIIGVNQPLSRLLATIMGKMPGKPFTRDNYLSLQVDSTCSHPANLIDTPFTPIEAVVPQYVGQRNQRAAYNEHRYHARREEG
ncbi:MAG: NAD-dependent epimerase/dehydratase [Halothiobacillaceae bacterium]|nr:MAG: NAD-dependent epimerase/dehydratase [Halothiobacillaceae bacterium]